MCGHKKYGWFKQFFINYMRNIKFLVLAVFVLMPFSSAKACNVRPYAISYINKINEVLGGTKPKLVLESGSEKDFFAFYDGKAIHIYKGDYRGKCSDETPFLKSVISHEYAHSVSAKLKKVANLKGEKLAKVAEHAIGDVLWGNNIEYDNGEDLVYPKDYAAMKQLVLSKQNVILKSKTNPIYFKSRK
jgi:hypothetical protein